MRRSRRRVVRCGLRWRRDVVGWRGCWVGYGRCTWLADPRRDPHGELAGGNVAGHHGPGAGPRPGADLARCHDHRVHADERAVTDRRLVLSLAVVVRGDRPGAHVDPLADPGIAQVTHVMLLGVRAEMRVLELGKVADLRAAPHDRPRSQVAVRADDRLVL